MRPDDPAVRRILHESMVARIATLSRNGRPSITPIYFVLRNGRIWIGTADWTLAARNAKADPRVTVLLQVEHDPSDRRMLWISGRATVRTDTQSQRSYDARAARKYMLTAGGIRHYLAHIRRLPAMRRYHAQSNERGRSCVLEVTPERMELIQ